MSYDQFARTFSKSREHHPWPELDFIIEDMIEQRYTSVLDIGCGNGRFLEEIHNREFTIENYLGIDSSRGMIEEAQRLHPEYVFEVCDMLDIHLHFHHREEQGDVAIQVPENPETLDYFLRRNDGKSFDSLLLLASFHHLETHEARLAVLRDMKPLLREWGRIYMTNWNLREQPRYESSHRGNGDYDIKIGAYTRYYHGFTLDELASLFHDAGYAIIEHQIFEGGRNIVSMLEI